jgi:death-on-curing protein
MRKCPVCKVPLVEKSLKDQAGAYMFYIIKNHVFMDGNKRTGLASAVTFLQWNNIMIAPFDEDEVFDFVVDVAAGPNDPEISIPRIAAWFENMAIA